MGRLLALVDMPCLTYIALYESRRQATRLAPLRGPITAHGYRGSAGNRLSSPETPTRRSLGNASRTAHAIHWSEVSRNPHHRREPNLAHHLSDRLGCDCHPSDLHQEDSPDTTTRNRGLQASSQAVRCHLSTEFKS